MNKNATRIIELFKVIIEQNRAHIKVLEQETQRTTDDGLANAARTSRRLFEEHINELQKVIDEHEAQH